MMRVVPPVVRVLSALTKVGSFGSKGRQHQAVNFQTRRLLQVGRLVLMMIFGVNTLGLYVGAIC
jgi:hypothetical protein